MTTATVLKEKIKTITSGITGVAKVEDYPTQDFSQFPAVEISFDGNTSEYETTNENLELFVYNLYLYQIIDGVFDRKKSRLILEELSDTIRDTFDSDEFLVGISMPSGKTLMGVRPTISEIGESDDGKYAMAKIEISIRVSKQV
jgi:hypothetical protein